MPVSGEVNEEFGVYASVCCGQEIVIAVGSRFPNCPKHPNVRTEWKSTASEPQQRPKSDKSAA
jgi:hypothetical protein